ncbi:uncharacterized protein LOC129189812 isoform X2 [Dunckerocampus dactyliophorus]|uniref:uncharacterized protein LOC129189812 isoform X2 n=1 Tax=Dunckerocampus dactyliophorus TaxID=161453 RepID=UPI002406C51A|nr:uncharacterized protein LOC129189812 isoform X2 [Dunckerocampus dactyliophorus]
MDVFEENMTPKAMLEKISELAHSHRKLMVVNAELRELLDAADDELTLMRSENDALRKQVKTMEQVITVGLQGETEPYGAHLGHDLDVKQRNTENKVQELEMESLVMKEQNAGLTSEVQSLQEQSKKDKISLKRFSVAIQNLEFCVEEAQVGLQQRDEIIQQNKLQLKQAEETVEEYFNIIKDLRLTNQELKSQLEDREDEASLDSRNDLMGEKEASNIPGMSFAEEVKLLASTVEMKSLLVPCKDSSHVYTSQEVHQPQSVCARHCGRHHRFARCSCRALCTKRRLSLH